MKKVIPFMLLLVMMLTAFIAPIPSAALAYASNAQGQYVVPEGYNAHDYNALVEFLMHEDYPWDMVLCNGERLSAEFQPEDPETWGEGFVWTNEPERRIQKVIIGTTDEQGNVLLPLGHELVGPLDLSGCTELTELVCSGNDIYTLNLGGCSNLRKLDCSGARLSSLNIDGCTGLQTLWFSDNRLWPIDISGLTELTSLRSANNSITHFNFSGIENLREMDINGNMLEQISLHLIDDSEGDYNYDVELSLSIDGIGYISAGLNGTGSLLVVSAEEFPGCTLVGWYDDNGNLVSTNLELELGELESFTEHEVISLTARFEGGLEAPEGYAPRDYNAAAFFLETEDENGIKNGSKLSPNYKAALPSSWSIGQIGNRITWTNGNSGFHELSGFIAGTALEQDPSIDWNYNFFERDYDLVGELNLSNCKALSRVVCSNNRITSLIVDGCTSLSEIECSDNLLTELDLADCPEMWRLLIANNDISEIDFGSANSPKMIDLRGNRINEVNWQYFSDYYSPYGQVEVFDMNLELTADDGGYVAPYTTTYFYIDFFSYGYCINAEAKPGYEFTGWYDEDGNCVYSAQNVPLSYQILPEPLRLTARFRQTYIPGDADSDGVLTISDALVVMRCVMGISNDLPIHIGDVDGDGFLTVADALLIARSAMGM
ncbi:MAG: hypothetical protein J1E60_05040 [Christensenellaceae bacterium]|nr:hypothetical protein [Christensenellaceae bacterium]